MKKKNLLINASLALGVGVGVFAGIGLHNGVAEVNEVKADYGSGTDVVYLKGDFNSWGETDQMNWNGSSYSILNVNVVSGQKFKVYDKTADAWHGGNTSLVGGVASGNFYAKTKDGDLFCSRTGKYDFYLTPGQGISVNYNSTDVPTTTYSYVVSYGDAFTQIRPYTEGGEAVYWEDAKPLAGANSGLAGLIKYVDNDEYNFWGIYRIDDFALSNWDRLILKKTGNVTGGDNQSTTMTISGTKKVYFENKSSTADSDVYAAIELAFDMAWGRGNYKTYKNSICYMVESGTASGFIARYKSIHETVNGAAILNNLSFFDNYAGEGYVTLGKIVTELEGRVSGSGGSAKTTFTLNNPSNTAIVVTVTAASIALLGTAGFFLLRRRKEN